MGKNEKRPVSLLLLKMSGCGLRHSISHKYRALDTLAIFCLCNLRIGQTLQIRPIWTIMYFYGCSRYRKDQDGIYRLQTVRYESLEVTQEMIRSECMQANNRAMVNYNLKYDNMDGKANYVLSVLENGEQSIKETEQKKSSNILITINDVDEEGNILKSEVVESGGIVKEQIVIEGHPLKVEGGEESGEESESETQPGRVTRSMKKKAKKGKLKSLPIVTDEDDFRYFSKDLILNYNKFEIKKPRT